MEQSISLKLLANLATTYRILIIIAAAFVISLLLVQIKTVTYEFEEGSKWKYADLIAPSDFAIRKTTAEIEKEKSQIEQSFSPYYVLSDEPGLTLKERITDKYNIYQNTLKGDTGLYLNTNQAANIELLVNILRPIYQKGIIEINSQHQTSGQEFLVNVVEGNSIRTVPIHNVPEVTDALKQAEAQLQRRDQGSARYLIPLVNQVIEPNLFFDETLTKQFLEQAFEKISLNDGYAVSYTHLTLPTKRIV